MVHTEWFSVPLSGDQGCSPSHRTEHQSVQEDLPAEEDVMSDETRQQPLSSPGTGAETGLEQTNSC